MEDTEKSVLQLLNKVGISVNYLSDLDEKLIDRDAFLSLESYNSVKELIPLLKKYFPSSSLNSLHSTAEKNQAWPLLNLTRQILKKINYKMIPKRVCNGYDTEGKKKFKRFFKIKKIETLKKVEFTEKI